MKTPPWRRYLRFWRSDIPRDVEDELRFHTAMRTQEYMARGMSEEDARRAVAERLGDVNAARDECVTLGQVREADARQAGFVDALRADTSYALRSLARTPSWTAVALLTIALGVGATTTVFAVADALIVRPLPYPSASRVYLARRDFTIDGRTVPVSLPFGILREWRMHARSLEAAAPFGYGTRRMGTGDDTVTVHVMRVDTAFLGFAGVRPLVGRNFNAEEMAENGPGAILLTEQFWRREYGSSREVVGTTVRFGDQPQTIVGVVPASLTIPEFRNERADMLVALRSQLTQGITVLVRLKPGVSREAAEQELDAMLARSNVPDVRPVPGPMPARLTRPQDWLAIREPLTMLTGAVALLLLVACTNVAHLLLARGAARQRELAVRHALGAARLRLVRQLVTESVVLASFGGALALVVGWAGLELLDALRPADLVALTHVAADRRLLVIAATLAIVGGLAIGVFSALRTAGRDLGISLRAGAWSTPYSGRRLRSSLVVGEVALSTTLLVGALLLIHAVFVLQRRHLGFDWRGLYTIAIRAPRGAPVADGKAVAVALRDRLSSMPGVHAVSLGTSSPGRGAFRLLAEFETPERPLPTPERATRWVQIYNTPPDYFAALRMPLLAGRTFDDGSHARKEIVISSTLAERVWPGESPLGRRMRNVVPKTRGITEEWQTVVGVVPDALTDLTEGTTSPGLYRPMDPAEPAGPLAQSTIIVRIDGSPSDAVARLHEAAAAVQATPSARPPTITNVRDDIIQSLSEPLFVMRILAAFATLGVVLAAVGLFGVISYSVGQRTREIGVRMTLGASRASIARLVVGDGIRLALGGIALGLAGAMTLTRVIQSQLHGVSPLAPFAFVAGAALLLAVAVVACAAPMFRATRIDPALAVRLD